MLLGDVQMKKTGRHDYSGILWMTWMIAFMAICPSCSKESRRNPGGELSGDGLPPEVRLAPALTKVSGDSFETGDRIGVFMFYPSDGSTHCDIGDLPAPYLDNEPFVCVEKSSGSGAAFVCQSGQKLRWKDEVTPADFICYHPYSEAADGQTLLHLSVRKDQSSPEALSDSDILWGRRSEAEPAHEYVDIITSHRTGQLLIELVPGKGYDAATLESALEGLVIKGGICRCVLDLSTGSLTAAGSTVSGDGTLPDASSMDADNVNDNSAEDVIPFADGLTFKALLPPQKIEDLMVSVRVAGMDRTLKTSLELASGHVTRCTITVNKLADGINVGIGGWKDDGEDFGGVLN